MSMTNNEMAVKDLGEAAVLLMAGMSLVEIKNIEGIYWFVFDDKNQCQTISDSYWFSNYSVDAKTFRETMNRLKNRIFSVKN